MRTFLLKMNIKLCLGKTYEKLSVLHMISQMMTYP